MVTLTGTLANQVSGTPHQGVAHVEPTVPVVIDTGTNKVLLEGTTVTLDANGSFTIDIPASDDPALSPQGFTYRIGFKLTTGKLADIIFLAPAATPALDLSDITPVEDSVGVPYVIGPQGPAGPQGIQGEQGLQGIQGEQGPQGPSVSVPWLGMGGLPGRNVVASQGTVAPGVNIFLATPFYLAEATDIYRMVYSVSVAATVGSVARLGIFGWDGVSTYTPVRDFGTASIETVGQQFNVDFPTPGTLPPGLYAVGVAVQAAVTLRTLRCYDAPYGLQAGQEFNGGSNRILPYAYTTLGAFPSAAWPASVTADPGTAFLDSTASTPISLRKRVN